MSVTIVSVVVGLAAQVGFALRASRDSGPGLPDALHDKFDELDFDLKEAFAFDKVKRKSAQFKFDGGAIVVQRDPSLVFYNRIPKCGSSSHLKVVSQTHHHNGFRLFHSRNYKAWQPQIAWPGWPELATEEELHRKERSMVRELDKNWRRRCWRLRGGGKHCRLFYDAHSVFLDLPAYNLTNVSFVNQARHPVSQRISDFYYSILMGRNQYVKQEDMATVNINECAEHMRNRSGHHNVQNSHPCESLTMNDGMFISYFCGLHVDCAHGGASEAGLRRAIDNVNKHYAAVTFVEHFEDGMRILNRVLPHFYGDWQPVKTQNPSSGGHAYAIPTQDNIEYFASLLAYDMRFYDYLKARFAAQQDAL